MSNLDYPISVLVAEAKKISNSPCYGHQAMTESVEKIDGINRAINILNAEKRKDELKEREKKEKALRG